MKPWVTKRIKLECYNATEGSHDALSVVIADDEAPMRTMLGMSIKSLGHDVVGAAANGQEAVDMVLKHRPDLVVMDINMPGRSGMVAARAILAEYSVPIIFCTGRADDEALQEARQLNIQSYLVKPFSKAQLKSAIAMSVAQHRNSLNSELRISDLEGELSTTRTVEYAVGLISRNRGITKEAALHVIEKEAATRDCSIIESAHHLIRAEPIENSTKPGDEEI